LSGRRDVELNVSLMLIVDRRRRLEHSLPVNKVPDEDVTVALKFFEEGIVGPIVWIVLFYPISETK
jgi:hypothetical protein